MKHKKTNKMDINKIRQIIELPITDEERTKGILNVIASDENALTVVLEILNIERKMKKELISDMNMELSRADVFIEGLNPAMLPKKEKETIFADGFTKVFVADKIMSLYVKYKGIISHNFNKYTHV